MTISLISFSSGITAKSAEVNANFQSLVNGLNGTTPIQILALAINNSTSAIIGQLPSGPGADQAVIQAGLPGDTFARIAHYLRTDGYGGIMGGVGSSITSHLYATASGFKTDETLTANIFQLGRGLFRQVGTFSGTGAGTATHGCGIAPDFVGITENVASSTTTVGVDSIGGTTVHVNIGAFAWIGVAVVCH